VRLLLLFINLYPQFLQAPRKKSRAFATVPVQASDRGKYSTPVLDALCPAHVQTASSPESRWALGQLTQTICSFAERTRTGFRVCASPNFITRNGVVPWYPRRRTPTVSDDDWSRPQPCLQPPGTGFPGLLRIPLARLAVQVDCVSSTTSRARRSTISRLGSSRGYASRNSQRRSVDAGLMPTLSR